MSLFFSGKQQQRLCAIDAEPVQQAAPVDPAGCVSEFLLLFSLCPCTGCAMLVCGPHSHLSKYKTPKEAVSVLRAAIIIATGEGKTRPPYLLAAFADAA